MRFLSTEFTNAVRKKSQHVQICTPTLLLQNWRFGWHSLMEKKVLWNHIGYVMNVLLMIEKLLQLLCYCQSCILYTKKSNIQTVIYVPKKFESPILTWKSQSNLFLSSLLGWSTRTLPQFWSFPRFTLLFKQVIVGHFTINSSETCLLLLYLDSVSTPR